METSIESRKTKSIEKDCYVRIGNNSNDAKIIGITRGYLVEQITQTSEAHVIGSSSPIVSDTNELMCMIKFFGFLPIKKLLPYHDNGKDGATFDIKNINLHEVFANLQKNEYCGINKGVCTYLDFFDKNNNSICESYYNVSVHFDGKTLICSSSISQGSTRSITIDDL